MLRYLSVCSGIEAASVAWHYLGWEPAVFSDIFSLFLFFFHDLPLFPPISPLPRQLQRQDGAHPCHHVIPRHVFTIVPVPAERLLR